MKRKILITGASGFLGSHLAFYLSEKGYPLVLVSSEKGWRTPFIKACSKDNVVFVQKNVLLKKGLEETLAYIEDVSTVIHLQREWGGEEIEKGLDTEIQYNLWGSVRFIRAVIKHVEKVIFTSSIDVYYPQTKNFLINESTIPNPKSFYSITKIATENYIKKIVSIHEKKLAILRLSSIFGPYDIDNKAIPNFIKAILKNESPVINGSADIKRNYIYIDDVCKVLELAIRNDFDATLLLNITTDMSYSLSQIVKEINSILGKNVSPILNEVGATENFPEYIFENKRLVKTLDFSPEFDLTSGLKVEIDWFKNYLNL